MDVALAQQRDRDDGRIHIVGNLDVGVLDLEAHLDRALDVFDARDATDVDAENLDLYPGEDLDGPGELGLEGTRVLTSTDLTAGRQQRQRG